MKVAHFAFFVLLLVHSASGFAVVDDVVSRFAESSAECDVLTRKVTIQSVARPNHYIVNEGPADGDTDVFSIAFSDFHRVDLEEGAEDHVWTEDQHKNCFVTYRSAKGLYLGVTDQEAVAEDPERSPNSKTPIRVVRTVSALSRPGHDYYGVYWQKDQLQDKGTPPSDVTDTFTLWNQKYWGAAQLIVADGPELIGRKAVVYKLYITNNSADAVMDKENQFKIEKFEPLVTTTTEAIGPAAESPKTKKVCSKKMAQFDKDAADKLVAKWTNAYVSGRVENVGTATSVLDPISKENAISCQCSSPKDSICIMAFLKPDDKFHPVSALKIVGDAATARVSFTVKCDANGLRTLKEQSNAAVSGDGYYCFAFKRNGLGATDCVLETCQSECRKIGWLHGECDAQTLPNEPATCLCKATLPRPSVQ